MNKVRITDHQRPSTGSDPLLSVIVPCFNEEDVIEATHARLVSALEKTEVELELLYVDDGSSDRTCELLRKIQVHDSRVRLIVLSRNFGHQAALTAALDHAEGDAVVVIDADLQDPPEAIPLMVALWHEGYDVVYGQRTERQGESWWKLTTSKWFYRIIHRLSDGQVPVDTADFRLLDRRVVEALRLMPEQDRFLRGMISWSGFRQCALPYERHPRHAGESKYSIAKLWRLATDGIFAFSVKPLHLATAAGFASLLFALVAFCCIFARSIAMGEVPTTAQVVLFATLFFGGVQLVCVGILGEYVGRIYRETKRRPHYLISDRVGFEGEAAERKDAERAA